MTGATGHESDTPSDAGLRRKLRTCLFLEDAEAAANFYVSVVPNSRIEKIVRPNENAPALVVEFTLADAPFMTLAGNPDPQPSPISSLSVLTKDQCETDSLWTAVIADGGEEGRCGWLKDRFGVHWQIVPQALPRLMSGGDSAASKRVQTALMQMHKIEIAELELAFAGN